MKLEYIERMILEDKPKDEILLHIEKIREDTFGQIWSIIDIRNRAIEMDYNITNKDLRTIAKKIEYDFNANDGITWEIIKLAIKDFMESD